MNEYITIEVKLSDDAIVSSKKDYQELLDDQLRGKWWTLADLEARTNRKYLWLRENILEVQKFKKMLDVENGGFVFYPLGRGFEWSFNALPMSKFLDEYFPEIMQEAKKRWIENQKQKGA